MTIVDFVLATGTHLVAEWTYDDEARPVTVVTLTRCPESVTYQMSGHVRPKCAVTHAATTDRVLCRAEPVAC
ncbi:hypothetical protein EXE59_09810 [Nocardioides eburneiflavus]|uniref:Uncharacterized protein n=1 Tax=Nocardioides eburneiflavus TaxID=2518372 RepID=A0A4Z1C1V1_9ACTN|nr:hypothetical protein [Nocardioides eburneiflavus]TGN64214.1 hypothetical protein EXE59_09810 [Nocardioides eburneiflavus]